MDVPTDLLEKLRCCKCGVYLSRGPVYLQNNGKALCGQCYAPDLPATRNTHYEAVANLLQFPSKNKRVGCGSTVSYGQEDEVSEHEEMCKYRGWTCPVLGSSHCDWQGSKADILKHCLGRHQNLVVLNPCVFEHDITKSSVTTVIVRAFRIHFLLHVKMCVTSGKIYHSVTFLGDSDSAYKFTYSVDVKRGECSLSRQGDVAPQGRLAIEEATSLTMDINSLLGVLGGFSGATFTVEVKRRESEAKLECTVCGEKGRALVYRDEDGWRCKDCVGTSEDRRGDKNQAQIHCMNII